MNFAEVMEEIGDRLDTVDGLRVYRYPPESVNPPCAVVTYPDEYVFDETFGRGSDRMTLSVVLLMGKVSDRKSRDRLAAWISTSGVRRFGIDNVGQLTRHVVSTDGTHASQAEIVDGNLDVTLTAGTEAGFSSLREVFLRDDLTGSDFHGRVTFDPPFFGDQGGGITVLPQHGLLLRYQRDTVQRGVAIWNNIIFGLPQLLVGVWQANLDGTSMVNRQAPGFPAPLGQNFPYTVEVRLRGNVVDVRQWEVGDQPPEWDDPTLARTIDLDTDAGDPGPIPTPVGEGGAGWIAAHLGTDDRSVVRYPLNDTFLELDGDPLKDVLEVETYTTFDTLRVQNAEFDLLSVGGVEYVGATLSLDISGPGSP